MEDSDWGMTTNLNAVFCDLILPLAVKNKVLPEDMIKRIFIFSDMQFDEARPSYQQRSKWETNYDIIAQEYAKHGYDVPQIVYWDLATNGHHTVEVQSDTKGVAMMNGFSPSMLKVFMGEESDDSTDPQPDKPAASQVKEVMTPISVMRKALKDSFDRLVVVD
ncbi:unnamed protein product [Cyclocybe aegerita]|uniref:DUF7788 domain-containing protein n=1 Tax=Cyclocybe aegerita TaxID=1973307 RepID=A0A8S0WLK1_CYCAE|nr:unnamed protein product [Cyclocybe aegerita]